MQIINIIVDISSISRGYIAGASDGILTVASKPAQRFIYLFDAKTLQVLSRVTSLDNGHYAFFGLDPEKRYLVMARDYKKEFEPFVWDDVLPATDKTIAEQQAMWQSFQI